MGQEPLEAETSAYATVSVILPIYGFRTYCSTMPETRDRREASAGEGVVTAQRCLPSRLLVPLWSLQQGPAVRNSSRRVRVLASSCARLRADITPGSNDWTLAVSSFPRHLSEEGKQWAIQSAHVACWPRWS